MDSVKPTLHPVRGKNGTQAMSNQKTLAMVQTAPGELEAQELPIPEIGHEEALLRIEACGICGSDYEQFEGVLKTPVPVIPGHEPLGVIERIGDGAAERLGVGPRLFAVRLAWVCPAHRRRACSR